MTTSAPPPGAGEAAPIIPEKVPVQLQKEVPEGAAKVAKAAGKPPSPVTRAPSEKIPAAPTVIPPPVGKMVKKAKAKQPNIEEQWDDATKGWDTATKGSKFDKLNASLKNYLPKLKELTTTQSMIETVKNLGTSSAHLPSIIDLMQKASALLNEPESSAAKILIAAQLLRLNPKLIDPTNPQETEKAIKSLILGGRWMIEQGEFMGREVDLRFTPEIILLLFTKKDRTYLQVGCAREDTLLLQSIWQR